MNILILLKAEADDTLQAIIEHHKKKYRVQLIHLAKVSEFDHLIDQIEEADIVFTW